MYMVFAGSNYYPQGGWEDHKGTFDTLEEALECAANAGEDWWHIVYDGKVFKSGSKSYSGRKDR